MSANGFKGSILLTSLILLIYACGATKSVTPLDKTHQVRMEIVDYADNYVGTKYKYAGRSPKSGFDCSGFTYYVMQPFDINLPTSSKMQEDTGSKVKVENTRPGDLIFFRRSKAGKVFHVALVYSNDRDGLKVIHSTNRGVVIDDIMNNSYWKPKISTARNVVD